MHCYDCVADAGLHTVALTGWAGDRAGGLQLRRWDQCALACMCAGFTWYCRSYVFPCARAVAAWYGAVWYGVCRFELRLLGPLAPGEEAAISYGETKPNPEVRGLLREVAAVRSG